MALSSMNWEGIAEVRLKMKEMGERKDLGFCWIELDGGDYMDCQGFIILSETSFRERSCSCMDCW